MTVDFRGMMILLFCCLSLFITACAAPVKTQHKVQFNGTNSQAVAMSPIYLPPPQEQRADHAWALTLKVSDGKPFFGLLKPNQLIIEPLFTYFQSDRLKPGQLPRGEEKQLASTGCQGNNTVQASIAADGSISGNMVYRDYSDNCSLSLDASLPFSGKLDLKSGQLLIDLTYEKLSARMGSRNFLLSGRTQLIMNAYQGEEQEYSAWVDMYINEVNGQEYHLEEMQLTWDLTTEYPKFSMAGEIYFSQYGEVQVVTDSPFISHSKSSPPFDGMLTFKGADYSWRRLYFPKSTDPGAFRIDGSNGMKTMGKF